MTNTNTKVFMRITKKLTSTSHDFNDKKHMRKKNKKQKINKTIEGKRKKGE